MEAVKRAVTFYTPDKIYSGAVDVRERSIRTLDLLNSTNIYWKDPSEKNFSDAILLNRASIKLSGGQKIGEFRKLQMRLTDIIFFTDGLDGGGTNCDRATQKTTSPKLHNEVVTVKILTKMQGDSFYIVSGKYTGLIKSKTSHRYLPRNRYLPITEAKVTAVTRVGERWTSKTVIDNKFIGMSGEHIESCSFN